MSILPLIIIVVGVCVAIDAVLEARITRIYSTAAVLAQEAVSSIKTVHAFWAQDKMVRKYDESLEAAHQAGKKKSPIFGLLFSTQYFCTLAGTALAFWQGFRMYLSGEIESVGVVLNVVYVILIGKSRRGFCLRF